MHLQDGINGQASDALHPGNSKVGQLTVVEHPAHRLHQLRHLDQPVAARLKSISKMSKNTAIFYRISVRFIRIRFQLKILMRIRMEWKLNTDLIQI
jgi:hypothetical protein